MPRFRTDRPFLDAWLRRIAREFAVSGRLSQTAMILAREEGGSEEDWCRTLRRLTEGAESPSLRILTRIDALLAGTRSARKSRSRREKTPAETLLFERIGSPQDPATRTP